MVRARGPMAAGLIGATMYTEVMASAAKAKTGQVHVVDETTGAGNIVSFRQLNSYPLIVVVGFGDRQVFRHFHKLQAGLLSDGGGATLVILLLGTVWVSGRKRALKSRRALSLTLENISQGIVMIDADGRIPVVNQRALELLGLPTTAVNERRADPVPDENAIPASGVPGFDE